LSCFLIIIVFFYFDIEEVKPGKPIQGNIIFGEEECLCFPKPFLFETRRMASLQGQAEVAAEGSEDSSGQYATSSVWFMFVNLQEKFSQTLCP